MSSLSSFSFIFCSFTLGFDYREENKTIPLGRPAQPNEVARLVVFLASDDNTYITGEAINISGGFEVH